MIQAQHKKQHTPKDIAVQTTVLKACGFLFLDGGGGWQQTFRWTCASLRVNKCVSLKPHATPRHPACYKNKGWEHQAGTCSGGLGPNRKTPAESPRLDVNTDAIDGLFLWATLDKALKWGVVQVRMSGHTHHTHTPTQQALKQSAVSSIKTTKNSLLSNNSACYYYF